MPRMSSTLTRVRLVLLAGLLTLAATAFALSATQSHAATATAAGSCSPASYPGSGYFTSLSVSGTSCSKGRKLQVAHYKCRVKDGKKGKCGSVSGYRCSEKRGKAISTEFNSRVTCKNGSRKVVWTYQQNL